METEQLEKLRSDILSLRDAAILDKYELVALRSAINNLDKHTTLVAHCLDGITKLVDKHERVLFRDNSRLGVVDRIERIEIRDEQMKKEQDRQKEELASRRKELRTSIYAFAGAAVLLSIQIVLKILGVL